VKDQMPELPEFAVVRAPEHGDRHALAPGFEGGPALCDLEPPTGGWFLVGFTAWPFLIPCRACRERVVELLAALVDGEVPGLDPA
jgi:hypothetical protein